MRVAIVANPYLPVPPPAYGGTERVVGHLIRGLLEAGHEPVLLASGDSQVDCELVPVCERAIGFPVHKRDVPEHELLVEEIRQYTHDRLNELLPRVDLVHSHDFDLIAFQDVPNLTTLHGPIDLDQLAYYLERKDLYYVSISQNQQGACPDLRYVGVVYNGEDPERFPVVTEPDEYVCFLGRFDREKNPHLAIQLAINLGVPIKVAGKIDFESEGYLEEKVRPYFDHPLVEYLGELAFDDKVKLLAHARCNLHPTGFREPFGLTVLEAALCGTPTLAIDRGSMPELIEVGRTGMLVEDFVEGYHQIQQCFEMNRTYIAQRARLLFNYQAMTDGYLRAYEHVIDIFANRREWGPATDELAARKIDLDPVWSKDGRDDQVGGDPIAPPLLGPPQPEPN